LGEKQPTLNKVLSHFGYPGKADLGRKGHPGFGRVEVKRPDFLVLLDEIPKELSGRSRFPFQKSIHRVFSAGMPLAIVYKSLFALGADPHRV